MMKGESVFFVPNLMKGESAFLVPNMMKGENVFFVTLIVIVQHHVGSCPLKAFSLICQSLWFNNTSKVVFGQRRICSAKWIFKILLKIVLLNYLLLLLLFCWKDSFNIFFLGFLSFLVSEILSFECILDIIFEKGNSWVGEVGQILTPTTNLAKQTLIFSLIQEQSFVIFQPSSFQISSFIYLNMGNCWR
eukprot:TRINITY_DN2817_c0_g1_i8.p3 TRINITY_DN2817_c0_g1~~TRINITY_DN2817_c0_g1_i8.p3  ORF type:complete len:190 (-),score=10.06 TRINITY_DN2817_c0_g1_i8:81-650(-)